MNFSSMKYLLKEGVKNVWNNRMMSFASIGVLVSCLLLTGAAVAFLVSLFAIRFLLSYIRKHDFKAFGWYRIVLGLLVLGYFFLLK